ncbi:LAP3 (YNL239W) [Zygosaccharomyces parabailii]|nr:LAP3 (YNL239W) [Zygosaccharomyces parabailii]
MSSLSRTMSSIRIQSLTKWDKELKQDRTHQLAATVLKNYSADDALLNRTRLQTLENRIFNTQVSVDQLPVTNQRSSGRCWLFAATNQLRLNTMQQLNIKEFELSQAYLFFYDKLEKANYFLEQIVETNEEPVESRIVQHLLKSPTEDGGQYSLFLNLVRKYGLVPKDLYGDLPYSTTASRKWNTLLTSKLREFAQDLRDAMAKDASEEDLAAMRTSMQRQLFEIFTLFMDLPPVQPDEEFTWTYADKDKKLHTIKTTPLQFARQYAQLDDTKPVSLINDPRHEYGRIIEIDRLGNVIGGDKVTYLNLDNETLSNLIVQRLKSNRAVFFGSHTPRYMDRKFGVMDTQLWNYEAIGYELKQSKESRIRYGESLMTHAMLITGAHLDESTGAPLRYRVENSWGKDSGKEGSYVMTQEYFEEHCFQIVVDIDELPAELASKFTDKKEKPIVLPLWDPMGALAQ